MIKKLYKYGFPAPPKRLGYDDESDASSKCSIESAAFVTQ
jgi:hypothetical protein